MVNKYDRRTDRQTDPIQNYGCKSANTALVNQAPCGKNLTAHSLAVALDSVVLTIDNQIAHLEAIINFFTGW